MTYRHQYLKQWNDWLHHHFLGQKILEVEENELKKIISTHYGKHGLLIGVPNQLPLLQTSVMPILTLLSPLVFKHAHVQNIENNLAHLPIQNASMDLALLPHILEWVDNPRQLLAEACRAIKPEGLIIIIGFNPHGTWGLFKKFQSTLAPWQGEFLSCHQIKNWLKLAEFEIQSQTPILFVPPFKNKILYNKLQIIEKVGRYCFPALCGGYILVAKAKLIPLTPIKLTWRQQVSGLRISSSISGQIVRQSK